MSVVLPAGTGQKKAQGEEHGLKDGDREFRLG